MPEKLWQTSTLPIRTSQDHLVRSNGTQDKSHFKIYIQKILGSRPIKSDSSGLQSTLSPGESGTIPAHRPPSPPSPRLPRHSHPPHLCSHHPHLLLCPRPPCPLHHQLHCQPS